MQSPYASDPASLSDVSVKTTARAAVPNGKKTYLHFNHAYQFDNLFGHNNDGGVLEYRTNKYPVWTDAGSFFTCNSGYNGTIATGYGNLLGVHEAFVSRSNGYRSSKVNLSSLAGQKVRFRFRVSTNPTWGDLCWVIDDVKVYTCTK